MPKRIYVISSREDRPKARQSLEKALADAGHRVADELSSDVDGAVVVVGPGALHSSKVFAATQQLLALQNVRWFPVVPLLADGMDLSQVRASALQVLGGIQMSRADSLQHRITDTLAALGAGGQLPAERGHHPFTTIRVINASPLGAVNSVATGEVAGRPVVAAALDDGQVQVWQLLDRAARPLVLTGHHAPVWTVAIGRALDRDVIVSGGNDRTVRVWDAVTGDSLAVITGHKSGVNCVAISPTGTYVASGSEVTGTLYWELHEDGASEVPAPSFKAATAVAFHGDEVLVGTAEGKLHQLNLEDRSSTSIGGLGVAVTAVAADGPIMVSGDDDGFVREWNHSRSRESHSGGVRTVAVGVLDGVDVAVSGGKDCLVQVWEWATDNIRKLEGHSRTVRGVAIGTIEGQSVIVSGGDDGTVRIWGDVVADHVEWLSDSPSNEDLLMRRPLARSVAARLRRMNDDEPGTSFLVHIDGPWGAGKSTLLKFLEKELEPGFTPIHFNAWAEAGVGPAWWALLTKLRTAVSKQRRWPGRVWLRFREAFARLRRVGAPVALAFAGLIALAGLVWWLFSPAAIKQISNTITGALAAIGTFGAGALVVSRFLLWDSARGAKLFEQSNTNPMLEVTRHFGWLMARSKKPVVFFIDDLDRCQDAYVVELLDSVQTLVRDASKRSAHFVVSADGAWIRTSYELAYEKFSEAVSAPGQPLGYLFLDKFFQLRIPVPSIDAPRQQQYLRELLKGPVTSTRELAEEEHRVREQLTRSTTEAQVIETLESASAEVRDRVAETALDKLTTPEAVVATEHSLQRFAPLLPANPRTMKRFVNAYSALRAVRTLEGNPVRVESLARWTVIEIRWPSLADYLRAHPEAISLVGTEELDDVPERLRALFGDPALRMITKADFDATTIRSCCGVSIPTDH
ncbi:P-loop NTPase fold protein [Kibdelosporangium aridum]|uniref:WD40 repeat n=1 Tax=Kibdelosporangium aridum TaxID=2030 RepID=A0A1Y5Y1Q4_KIBAR|nr:P-loop NTPase fold protein [Kibdelosporangium aridum]SMD21896.1 WD40 repeat [Kibdelosporangium aridum]